MVEALKVIVQASSINSVDAARLTALVRKVQGLMEELIGTLLALCVPKS